MEASTTPTALWGAAAALRVIRPAAIVCRRLRRRVGRRWLLDGFSLSVPAGARLLVVSRPEASASLLLRVLAGLARLDGGEVELAGISDRDGTERLRRVGYLGPEPGIHHWMTPRQVLALSGRLRGLARSDLERAVAQAAEAADLGYREVDRPISRGGGSLLARASLAAALVGDPEVLLLDEPMRALEPAQRARLLRLPDRRLTVVTARRDPGAEGGASVTHLAYLRDGRLALLAPIAALTDAGLPLTMDGVEQLARRPRRPRR